MATVSVTPYILNGLSEDESWSLFQQMAFSDGVKRQNPGLIEVGKEIVRKCSGIPLAIRNVGSLLYINDTEKEWLHFKDNKLSKIADTKSSIFSILKLSYDYLPLHLKRCFAYCSLFPKGHNIDKLVLIQLWIAQGLIQPSDENKSMEDLGEQYFLDLFRRSFLQDVAQDELGSITICKMHDLIHELSELVAGSENCLVGLDAKGLVTRTRHVSFGFVLDSSWNIPSRLLYANQLRTLLFPVQKRKFYSECMDKVVCHEVISSFKCLRALDMHQMGMRTIPSTIRDLRHLRFLDLSFNYFRFLPKSICKLLNLQTLKLNRCHNLEELPSKTKNLVSLRHLEIDGCMNLSSMPHGIERLTSLQTLTRFIVGSKSSSSIHSARLGELISLVNLRGRLSIERLRGSVVETSESDQSCFYVRQMEHLQFLILKWDDRRAVTDQLCIRVGDDYDLALFERLCPHKNVKKLQIENYGGVSFPSWLNTVNIGFSLPNVVEISVSLCHRCQHLPPFGLLPSLQVLSIFSMDSLEYIYEDDEEIWSFKKRELFPSPKKLHLSDLKMLKGLGRNTRRKELPSTCSSGSMRSLISLHISYCPCIDLLSNNDDNSFFLHNLGSLTALYISSMPKLECLPLGLQYLTKLESLFVTHCESLVAFSDIIEKLESLQLLLIHNCESLTSLPDSLSRLAALKELEIIGCPQLVARCRKETGKDWPKIAHITCVKVED